MTQTQSVQTAVQTSVDGTGARTILATSVIMTNYREKNNKIEYLGRINVYKVFYAKFELILSFYFDNFDH